MDDFVTEFNEKTAAKSREVCERIEREDAERRGGLSEVERRILEAWPRFEDGKPVWFGDAVEAHHGGAIPVEAIEFTAGKVHVKDAEDGDWNNSMCAIRPLKRPAPKVLDADGVEIKVGDTVYGIGRNQHLYEIIDPHHIDPEVGAAFSVRCYDRDESAECHCRPELLTHTLPDSWGLLEKDADSGAFHYCVLRGIDYERGSTRSMMEAFASDIIRRAKALAGVEAARDED